MSKKSKLDEMLNSDSESDELINGLLARLPELQRTIVMIFLENEGRVDQSRLAELSSERLEHPVTRDEIAVALMIFRRAMYRSVRHKQVEGWLEVAAQIRRGLTGRIHSDSTEVVAEDRQR
jgi:hypothetical protein